MSIEMQTGTQVEVTCDSDAGLYAGMQGSGSYVLDKPLEVSMPDTNTVTVGPGHILQNGFHVWLKGATDFTIPSGVQAQKRSIIVGFRSTKTRDEETMETIIRSDPLVLSGEPTMDGTPEDPEWIEGDLSAGDTIADFPICRVVTDGINALEPVPMYQVLASAAEMQKRWDSLCQEGENTLVLKLPFKWRVLLWRFEFQTTVGESHFSKSWPNGIEFSETPFGFLRCAVAGDPACYLMYTGISASGVSGYVKSHNGNICWATALAIGKVA